MASDSNILSIIFSLDLIFAPRKYSSLGLLSFFHQQGLRGIFTLIENLKLASDVRKLVQIGVDIFRLIIGSSECSFLEPRERIRWGYEDWDWFLHIYDFLFKHGLSFDLLMPKYYRKKCVRDQNLVKLIGVA